MQNKRVHFVYVPDPLNSGDYNSCPFDYFKNDFVEFECYRHDIRSLKRECFFPSDFVIIGGGGLFDVRDDFNENINYILNKCYRVFGWGVGFNKHHDRLISNKINFSRFVYIGCRDYNSPYEYVPCVSCMNSVFDSFSNKIVRQIGVIENFMFPIDEFKFEKMSNMVSVENVISFICQSETIISNSYHALYWALLLGKKVILYNSFSSKFYGFKSPLNKYSGNIEKDLSEVRIFPSMLEEARDLNIKYKNKVINFIRSF